ncbi:MAG: thioredoxin family protein [Desulfobacteraceae bacterium]
MHKPTMRFSLTAAVFFILICGLGLLISGCSSEEPVAPPSKPAGDIPVKGMPTMVDLGANECIPCKMMVPVLEKVEKKYQGKAAIIIVDVYKDKEPAKRFGVRAIPTQIFFDKEGKEVHRHEGFMGEADIDRVFKEMGVS